MMKHSYRPNPKKSKSPWGKDKTWLFPPRQPGLFDYLMVMQLPKKAKI